ncbi:tyrosine-type recombinase/integrase [Pontibacter akesuensis]|uniref:Site-specific recombinase XerD n=1 Tax=Pontibacter akesuensis TaxID=388950 RepID=A0A1I7IM98_9BACT|nr:site-specific integrase [Pontibacter akesuensis]GHA67844.1 tyrosine recombinase [Pontibacter akesuensis]SFU74053.1 Site-specific recombinase XerD [Pontibacter akesuensis]
MGITVRHRKLSNGKQKIYLDIVQAKKRKTETTKWQRYEKPRTQDEKEHNRKVDQLAEMLRADREKELFYGEYDFKKASSAKADFIELFREEADERFRKRGAKSNTYCSFKHFCKFTNNKCSVKDIDAAFVKSFRDYLLTVVGQNCASTYFKRFKRQLERAVKKGMLSYNPAEEVKNIQEVLPYRERLTIEEVKMLAEHPCKCNLIKSMFMFSCFTGLRVGDLKAIKWKHIQGDTLVFRPQKTKYKLHTLQLIGNAKRWLGEEGKPEDNIFPWPYESNRYEALREWIYSAAITRRITWHTARHTFASMLLNTGGNIVAIQKLLCHSRMETTMRYAKVYDITVMETVGALDSI